MSNFDITEEKKKNIIEKLLLLEKHSNNKGDIFRGRSYKKASEIILEMNNLKHLSELKNKNGIGKTIFEKIEELLKYGKIEAIEKEKNNPIHTFNMIYGVGPKKSQELAKQFSNIEELRIGSKLDQNLLNEKQKIGLRYFESILKRIPRIEIDEYNQLIKRILRDLKTDLKVEIVGSYRRGLNNSGDIDIIITSKNHKNFDKFIRSFEEHGIIKEYLSKGSKKCLIIGKLNNYEFRRIDFMYTNEIEFPFALLYFTGSKEFNVRVRSHALSLNYTLNEHGIKCIGKKDFVDQIFKDEKDIFDFLGIKYKSPNKRNNDIIELVNSERDTQETNNVDDDHKIKGFLKITKKNRGKILKNNDSKIEKLVRQIHSASDAYYNGSSILTDREFDDLQEKLKNIDPENPVFSEVGAPVSNGRKVQLPYYMPSMDKVKPDTLEKWLNKYKNNFVISAKLDGVSALYVKNKDKSESLYTRGNGSIGQDISHLIKLMKPIIPIDYDSKVDNVVIRGELIISIYNFDQNYDLQKANARNTVSGLINKKSPKDTEFKFVDFVAYEVIEPVLNPLEQIQFLNKHKINTVQIIYEENSLDLDNVSNILLNWRSSYLYSIDGVILTHNDSYVRCKENPKHSVAFKMILEDQSADSKVINVSWQISKHGLAKPVVNIEPVKIGGIIIKKISGQNANFIEKNKIGEGAIVQVVRRGDVIPYIEKIKKPSEKSSLPNFDYTWTDSHVDIIVTNHDSADEQKIYSFLVGYNANGIGIGTVKKIRSAGFKNLNEFLNITKEELMKIDGFAEKSSEKIYQSLQIIKKKMFENLPKLMALSGSFGRGIGEKKIKEVFNKYPNVLKFNTENKNELIIKFSKIQGFSHKSSKQFLEGLQNFSLFVKKLGYNLEQLTV